MIKSCLAAAALFTVGAGTVQQADAAFARREPNGAIRFYDDHGGDRGYAWCLRRGGRAYGGWADCSYYTYAQCRSSVIGPPGGSCEPNPWSYYVTEPPVSPRKRARH